MRRGEPLSYRVHSRLCLLERRSRRETDDRLVRNEEVGEQSAASTLTVYVPYVRAGWRTMAVLARANGAASTVTAAVRGAVRAVDPGFAAYDVQTMTDRRLMTTWGERFLGRTFAAFSIMAVFLACLGVYGLTAHAAAQRRREIGIRLAVGAQRRDIIRLLVGPALDSRWQAHSPAFPWRSRPRVSSRVCCSGSHPGTRKSGRSCPLRS